MTWKWIFAVTLAAALSAEAQSRSTSMVSPSDSLTAGTKRTPYIGWGGIGFYNVSRAGSSGAFGVHAGGAVSLLSLMPDLPLIGWADAALAFPSGATLFPLKAGAGVRYDRAGPVQLLGGVAFVVMPNTGTGTPTPVGVGLMGTVLYPLPQVNRNLSAQAQIGYDFLSDDFGLFELTFGAGWAF